MSTSTRCATRNTVQRTLVLDAVKNLSNHPSANEVFDSIKRDYPGISRATVYRNLHLLVDKGAIRRVQIPGDIDRYDHTIAPHYHVTCRKCGRVDDVFLDDTALHFDILESEGFAIEGYTLSFEGLCAQCRNAH